MVWIKGAFQKGWNAMLAFAEILRAALRIASFRPLRRWAAPASAVLVATISWSPSARAADIAKGHPNYTLPAGQVVNTDLIVTASSTQVDGEVDGDLIAFSQSIVVNGHVTGDVLAFGQDVFIGGTVDGNVRSFSQSLALNGSVGKNVMAWGRNIDMNSKANVLGTMTLGSAGANLSGPIHGDLLAFAGVLNVDGALNKNANIHAGRLNLGPDASVAGRIRYEGQRQPEISPGAKLASPIETHLMHPHRSRFVSAGYYWSRILFWAASFLFGVVLWLLAPRWFLRAENATKNFGLSIGVGILFLFATPIAAILACITIVGLGLGLSALLLYGIALYAAQVFVAMWVGDRILGETPAATSTGSPLGRVAGRLALGLVVLRVLQAVPVLGAIVSVVIVLWGLGAILLGAYRGMRAQPPYPAQPASAA
jgi:cytoskeletal protein CcmA (bactofilin family)